MTGPESSHAAWVLLVGGVIVLAVLVRLVCVRFRLPPVVGFITLGLLVGWADREMGFVTDRAGSAFDLFADLGVVALLFRVGLDSDAAALFAKLPRASVVWVGNVTVAAAAGFGVAYYVAGTGLIPALVVATAFSATSVGVSTAIWRDAGALQSSEGQLLVDVAELDDVSAIAAMALLFAVVPVLLAGEAVPWMQLAGIGASLLLKVVVFMAGCVLFAWYLEPRVARLVTGRGGGSQRMLIVAGLGFMIAAMADWLGFSLAIGALGAGLVFSRDPRAVRTEGRFEDLYALFVPFFFIRIGMGTEFPGLSHVAGLAVILFAAAALGKLAGAGVPAWFVAGPSAAMLIGLSMVPRAEIAMVVVDAARRLGPQVMPDDLYAAIVLVVLGTCLSTPWLLAARLARFTPPAR